jgi:ribonucleoside-diphosphate reductase alpha chain
VCRIIVRNLNKIIDINDYPLPEAKVSNLKHRPIGIGVQGLADVFMMLKMPYASNEAKSLNTQVFETIYFAALTESNELAKKFGVYDTYSGSPVSKGILQFDMWPESKLSGMHDWASLKRAIIKDGVRNSLLIAPMPTASTSQILGNTESFEPLTSNIYTRRVLAGNFVVLNKYLYNDLKKLGLWTREIKDEIIANNGSVQKLNTVPVELKEIYKTVWEIKQRDLIDMAADRGAFIDQSQSLNLYKEKPTIETLDKMHIYSWEKGLKTGIYYFRTQAVTEATKVTLSPVSGVSTLQPLSAEVCKMEEGCIVCSS